MTDSTTTSAPCLSPSDLLMQLRGSWPDADTRRRVQDHLAVCVDCRAKMNLMRGALGKVEEDTEGIRHREARR